ncbi:fibronectin type III domain-containing protein [Planctomycetota bacterium]
MACLVLVACAGTSAAGAIRGDVRAWILANNPGLRWNFLKTELPHRPIKLPNGKTVPLFKIKQFHGANFQLTFHARKKEGVKIVSSMAKKLRKLMARPEFYRWIKRHRGHYKIHGKRVSSKKAYNHFRKIHRRLGVAAGKRYRAPVGGGSGIGAPSWAVWRQMNLFFHEACHCIGIGHKSGGLSGPLAGQLRRWDRQKRWNYQTIDLNTLRVPPAPPGGAPIGPVASTSIQANWTANGNPLSTEYLVECWEGPDFAGAKVGDSGWARALMFDFTELTPSSPYSFRVRARNRHGVKTVWVALTSGGASTQAPFRAPPP